ncbi:stage V sporulation protein B [Clostridia bacterium]|nr:stage V sporulation protein B [Clostridia bacterium]
MNTAFSKHPLLTGTLLLTLAGLASRVIGFFFRIFLSHTIGAEGLGIYQLIFPVLALSFSLTAAGIQTAISKFVAGAAIGVKEGKAPVVARATIGVKEGKDSLKDSLLKSVISPLTYLWAGLILSLLLCAACTFFVYYYAEILAVSLFHEPRCIPLLKILALSIPFGGIHACINGYFYGLKKTAVPAISQLLEQIARVGAVYVIYSITIEQGGTVSVSMAVWGILVGEVISVLYSITMMRGRSDSLENAKQKQMGRGMTRLANKKTFDKQTILKQKIIDKQGLSRYCPGIALKMQGLIAFRQILLLSAPLTANRVLINLMQSVEAILIPAKLRTFGYSHEEALSLFGVLAGMAMPIILFPSVVTGSLSVMLLPAISEAQAKGDVPYIKNAVKKSCFYCITFGLCATLGFLLLGKWFGTVVFSNEFAGTLIMILAWICPFLYLTTTLNSILNGLGKTTLTLCLNLLSSGIRIFFICFLMPTFGIKACLWGMLAGDLVVSLCSVAALKRIVWR